MLYKRSISPLIATILLIVVSVILITVVLTWGKGFVTDSFSQTDSFSIQKNLKNLEFIKFENGINGRFFFDYYPPNNNDLNFTVVSYSYNDYPLVPLEPEKTISSLGTFYLDLGIVDTGPFMINLVLSDGSYLSFENITSVNRSPSPNDCPKGYIPVPGNYLYNTVGSKGGFCVMKYEAKVDENGDGIGDVNYDCNYSATDFAWNHFDGCPYTENNRKIVSSAEGFVLGNINQNEAKEACQSIGVDYHLITNKEWMTIARNIELNASNWTGNCVNCGILLIGNIEICSLEDLYCYNSDKDPDYGINRPDKAKHNLTNNVQIFDFGANIREMVDQSIPKLEVFKPIGFSYWFKEDITDTGFLKYKDYVPLNLDLNIDHGVGEFRSTSSSSLPEYIYLLRGGYYWGSQTGAGIFATSHGDPNYRISRFGFRCVYAP